MKKIVAIILKFKKLYIQKNPLLLWGYNKLNFHKKRRIRNLHKYGKEVLEKFDQCCTTNGYHYTIAFGTLLGAIRDKCFIKTDDDIDVTMWIDEFSPKLPLALQQYGFKYEHTFIADDSLFGREDTFSYKGVNIDIFYIYESGDKNLFPYCCDFKPCQGCSSRYESLKKYGYLIPRQIFIPISKKIKTTNFIGIEVPIPENAEEILRCRYGDSYMTPIPRWISGAYSDKYTNLRTDKKATYITY